MAAVLALTVAASALTAVGVHWLLDKAAPLATSKPESRDEAAAVETPQSTAEPAEEPPVPTPQAMKAMVPADEAAENAANDASVIETPPAMPVAPEAEAAATVAAATAAAVADKAAEAASHDTLRLTAAPHPAKQSKRFRSIAQQ